MTDLNTGTGAPLDVLVAYRNGEPLNIVECWLSAELAIPGVTKADALAALNDECGKSYHHSTLSAWRQGKKTPAACALRYMVARAVEMILRRWTGPLDDEAAEAIAAAFSPPEKP